MTHCSKPFAYTQHPDVYPLVYCSTCIAKSAVIESSWWTLFYFTVLPSKFINVESNIIYSLHFESTSSFPSWHPPPLVFGFYLGKLVLIHKYATEQELDSPTYLHRHYLGFEYIGMISTACGDSFDQGPHNSPFNTNLLVLAALLLVYKI